MKNYRAILSLVRDMDKLIDKAYDGIFDEETGEIVDMARCAAGEALTKTKWRLLKKAGVNVDRFICGCGSWWKCAVRKYMTEKIARKPAR